MSLSFVLIDQESDTLFSLRGRLDKESKDHSPTPVPTLSAAERRVSTLWYLIFLYSLCSSIQQILFLSQIDTHSLFHTTHHTLQLTTLFPSTLSVSFDLTFAVFFPHTRPCFLTETRELLQEASRRDIPQEFTEGPRKRKKKHQKVSRALHFQSFVPLYGQIVRLLSQSEQG
ncbi:hypothetical protein BKA57DRAFT_326802 [Linnemannia elongata]|nr:hypothetical protein BKA57DRAFT_326802 [Linnemannia elongata]